jgi:hypothetical protein
MKLIGRHSTIAPYGKKNVPPINRPKGQHAQLRRGFATLTAPFWSMEAISRMSHTNSSPARIAAIDFGSNSFHIAAAAYHSDHVDRLLRQGERVQLAAGIRERRLDPASIARALDCVRRFAELMRSLEPQLARAVATHAVRIVDNADEFLLPAQELLEMPIEVISGGEEARLTIAVSAPS